MDDKIPQEEWDKFIADCIKKGWNIRRWDKKMGDRDVLPQMFTGNKNERADGQR